MFCAEWRMNRVLGNLSTVFATFKHVIADWFLDFLELQRVIAKVDRIVVSM